MGTGIDYVEVDFGDRTRRLRYGIGTLRDLCQALGGVTLLELLTRLAGMDVNAILQCIRYGLVHEDPKITLRTAADLLEAHVRASGDASRVLTAISEALDATGLISLAPPARSEPAGEAPGGPPPA